MKKILFSTLLFLYLTNLFAQTNADGTKSSVPILGVTALPDLKLTVTHGGFDGAVIKNSSGAFSTVDVDAFNGASVMRLANNGNYKWLLGNSLTNFFRIYNWDLAKDALVILPNSNVGVGTDSPNTRFEITQTSANTDLRISADCGFCSTRLSFISDRATGGWRPGYIASGDNGNYTGRLDFFTNGSANQYGSVLGMSVMNRRVTIGGAFVNSNPYVLEVHPSISNPYGILNFSDDNAKYWEQIVFFDGTFNLFSNNVLRGSFSPTTGAYTSSSDRSFKTNIVSLSPILDKVMALQPSSYEYIDNNPNHRQSIGLIAQDVENIFPEFVYKNIDKRANKELYTMDYAGLSVIALKAIQEQQAMIKELQAEILKLKK